MDGSILHHTSTRSCCIMHQAAGKIHHNSLGPILHVNGEATQGERAKEERDERENAGERDREIIN